jgi:hypothetical protein
VLPSVVTRAFVAALALLLIGAPAAAADDLPLQLPGDATASSVRADPDTWIVGGVPGKATAKLAKRYRAGHIGLGGYEVARRDARSFANALRKRGLLVYAQANILVSPLKSVPSDPLSGPPNDWRAKVASPALTPPPVTLESPLIALVDAASDLKHPEWTGNPWATTIPGTPVTSSHGTATQAVAAAPQNGRGIVGVWPGARALNVPLATVPGTDGLIKCSTSGRAIETAVANGASVINMSYSSPSRCASEWVQIYYAVAKGIIPVAAAGNEFETGNPLEFPASLPHVVTVAATTADDRSADFSNVNDAIDLSAPGVGIMTAVPPALDGDGAKDGYEPLSGTSFSAPMVSAAMAWVRAARPELTPDRVVQAVRMTARDVDREGWDALTGFGVLDVGAALSVPVDKLPIQDPLEPNDNLSWVNGRAFGKPATPVWSGGKAVRVSGLLDVQEDPVDTYRIVVAGGKSAKVSAIPLFGDPALEVFHSSAFSVNEEDGIVASSTHRGSKKTERVTVRNPGTKKRSYYVVVRPQGNSRNQEREYTLRVG